jgi:hypothetical protein
MRRILIVICAFVFVVAATAQDAPARPKHKRVGGSAVSLPSTKQSPEMKKMIDTFSGHWKTTTTFDKNEWFPQAGTYHGRASLEAGPAGNSLREHHMTRANFAGFGLYWYDPMAKSYAGVWCDTMDPRGCGSVGTGNWEGDNFVLNNEMDMGQQGKMKVRETFSNITKDSYDFVIESSMGDGPMKKMMSIKYERIASTTKPAPAAQPGN